MHWLLQLLTTMDISLHITNCAEHNPLMSILISSPKLYVREHIMATSDYIITQKKVTYFAHRDLSANARAETTMAPITFPLLLLKSKNGKQEAHHDVIITDTTKRELSDRLATGNQKKQIDSMYA
ncbi:uncharacterized protein AKAW2_11806A [Aspergillus luchuensis]|uniref:Uncharacterized protein n=1 Tax=Aspergillus kawachii TaxID=1069201 RepID=A0A7R7ZU44_ASPKA|nr:uncharacterized protein AKAW2_11806A [Aspergillus luchuensis]BCR94760.1 hypothetical protein AKAW2_11806A [Aspergillus luchuensis]